MGAGGMHGISIASVVLMMFLGFSSWQTASADCHADGAATISLILNTQRNSTGHRNIKISLQSRAVPGRKSADLNGVEASQSVRICDGIEVVDTSAIITAAPANVRSPGYDVFPPMGFYKFHNKSVTWDEAYLICVSEGSYLMIVNSEAESSVVKQFLNRKITVEGATWAGWMWSGYHDRGVEGDYRTVHGDPLNQSGYTKWHPGQPDNKPWGIEPDQDCGSINKEGLLNDLPCTGKLPFICEQSM